MSWKAAVRVAAFVAFAAGMGLAAPLPDDTGVSRSFDVEGTYRLKLGVLSPQSAPFEASIAFDSGAFTWTGDIALIGLRSGAYSRTRGGDALAYDEASLTVLRTVLAGSITTNYEIAHGVAANDWVVQLRPVRSRASFNRTLAVVKASESVTFVATSVTAQARLRGSYRRSWRTPKPDLVGGGTQQNVDIDLTRGTARLRNTYGAFSVHASSLGVIAYPSSWTLYTGTLGVVAYPPGWELYSSSFGAVAHPPGWSVYAGSIDVIAYPPAWTLYTGSLGAIAHPSDWTRYVGSVNVIAYPSTWARYSSTYGSVAYPSDWSVYASNFGPVPHAPGWSVYVGSIDVVAHPADWPVYAGSVNVITYPPSWSVHTSTYGATAYPGVSDEFLELRFPDPAALAGLQALKGTVSEDALADMATYLYFVEIPQR